MKSSLQITVAVCCIVLTVGSIGSCGYAAFLSQKRSDWRDIHYELVVLIRSTILAAIWKIALFKDSCRFFLVTCLITMLPFGFAVAGFISVLYDRIYIYEEIFIDVGIAEDDIPFYSLLLAFIWIILWCIPTVTFFRFWTLEKSSHTGNKPATEAQAQLLPTPV